MPLDPIIKRGPGRPRNDGTPTGTPRLTAKEAVMPAPGPRPRGRPRKDGTLAGSPRPAPPRPAEGERETKVAIEVVAKARARSTAELLAEVASRPELRFLERTERLAWLCGMIDREHVDHHVKTTLQGIEVVETPTDGPRFKALELLMRACGDFGQTTVQQNIQVNGAGRGPKQGATLIVVSNGRGPATIVESTVEEQKSLASK